MIIRLAVEEDFDVCVELLKSDEALSTPDGTFFEYCLEERPKKERY